jgi:hypothetical protein
MLFYLVEKNLLGWLLLCHKSIIEEDGNVKICDCTNQLILKLNVSDTELNLA